MNLLISSCSDPYWNLATEEFLLKSSNDNYIILYVNKPSVVVGKHQIAQKEVNSKFINDNNILIARRLTGGGSVYHDEGNLNISFIQTGKSGENILYKTIIHPFFFFLKNQIPELELNDRNDFVVDGKKISGSAMHIFKNRILAHCTLLVDCNLKNLSESLKGYPERFTDKSIPSKRSDVMNISQKFASISIDKMILDFVSWLKDGYASLTVTVLNSNSEDMIQDLVTTKYSTISWIYGYSPKYIYQNFIPYGKTKFHFTLEVEKGIIEGISLDSNNLVNHLFQHKLIGLKGMEHNPRLQLELKNANGLSEIDEQFISSLL